MFIEIIFQHSFLVSWGMCCVSITKISYNATEVNVQRLFIQNTLLHYVQYLNVKRTATYNNQCPLTFYRPVFTYVNTCRKTPLELHFIYLGKIYCTFRSCCIVCVLFSTKCRLFHNIFFIANNMLLLTMV